MCMFESLNLNFNANIIAYDGEDGYGCSGFVLVVLSYFLFILTFPLAICMAIKLNIKSLLVLFNSCIDFETKTDRE